MNKEIESYTQENTAFLAFEKRLIQWTLDYLGTSSMQIVLLSENIDQIHMH